MLSTILKPAFCNNFILRWNPQVKLVGLMSLIFSFAFAQSPIVVAVMVLISTLLYFLSGLSFSYWLARIRIPAFFMIITGIFLVLFSGNIVLLKLGPLSIRQEGLFLTLIIFARFLSIMTVMIVLFGTSSILSIIKAMRALGLPAIMADMTLFFYRYLFEIGKDLQTMQIAMRLRGFENYKLANFKYLASLAGSLLVRSYEQSELVYSAMTLRGYGQPAANLKEASKAQTNDYLGLTFTGLIALVIVIGELYLS